MAMYEKGMWEREQCEYVETILHILSKAYQRSHKDRFNIDIKKVKVLRSLEDENPKPIDVMKCLLPESIFELMVQLFGRILIHE